MDWHRFNSSCLRRALAAPSDASSDYDLDPQARPAAPRRLRAASVLVPVVELGGAA